MTNLLSPQEKKAILSKQKLKLLLILETGFFVFLISGLFVLFSIQVYLGGEIDSQKAILSQKEKPEGKTAVLNFKKDIEQINKKLRDIKFSLEDRFYLTDVLENISVLLPERGYLTNFSFRQDLKSRKISVSGFVPEREDLLLFQKNLEADDNFTNVYLPPANWVKSVNIDFSVSFELKSDFVNQP